MSLDRFGIKCFSIFNIPTWGIAIFDKNHKNLYANTLFYQNYVAIVENADMSLKTLAKEEIFQPAFDFVKNHSSSENYFSFTIQQNARTYAINVLIFEDDSFEIFINDISKSIKKSKLKQEMTNNIAHELRTPVTSLHGYLETLSDHSLDTEKQKVFIERAYRQTLRLSALLEDLSLITKMEEASSSFPIGEVSIQELLNELRIDLIKEIKENHIDFQILIDPSIKVKGNYTLLHSIFRNLLDNTIAYAGKNVKVEIKTYKEDKDFIYLTYRDTWVGVEEESLGRLFERFYRQNQGRTRTQMDKGSGLGLSIVKNAVQFHGGKIIVRNNPESGLEFLFTIRKETID